MNESSLSTKNNNFPSNLIPYFLLIFSVLILIYTFYKSEIVYNGSISNYYFKYYLVSIALIVFSVISFFLKKQLKINFFLISISIIFSLYLIELFFGLYDMSKYSESNYGLNFQDKRTKYQVYQDLKNSGKRVVVPISPLSPVSTINDEDEVYPLSGMSNTTTIYCNENGYWVIYKSDRYGFNNPDEEWDKSILEFVLVGDSFTHGSCVNKEDTIAGNLRLKNDGSGVLNLGYDGNGPLVELATLKEYLPYIKTKNVLWIFYEENDLTDLKREISNKTLKKYLDQDFNQNLIKKQNEIDIKISSVFEERLKGIKKIKPGQIFVDKFQLINFLKLKNLRLRLSYIFNLNLVNTFVEINLPLFSEILYKADNLVKKNNGKLYFVSLPMRGSHDLYNQETEAFNTHKKILNIVNKLDIPIIDIYKEVFAKHPDPLSLFPFRKLSFHYNEEGYKLVSEAILDKIKID